MFVVSSGNGTSMKDFVFEDEEDDDYDMEDMEDPYENLTLEELKKKMPPYFFKQGKSRRKYFVQMNKDYKNKMNKQEKRQSKQDNKVNFNIGLNEVKSFFF